MNDLPNAVDIDPDTITAPVETRQGWVTPNPESITALERLVIESKRHPSPSGTRRQLERDAEALAQRLRIKHAGHAAKLAQIDELIA